MKRAVSISIGSVKRDKSVEVELLGEKVLIERIGTDGDMKKATQMYEELDGKVGAFGVGGADLGLLVDNHWYPLYSVLPMVRNVKQTPVVDGTGLKNTLERKAAPFVDERLAKSIPAKKVLVMTGSDRWGLAHGFVAAGYELVYGDLQFSLGVPIALHTEPQIKRLAGILMPIASRLPFNWVYPTGEEQEKRSPKWEQYFNWASVIAGDCHYIKRYMPDPLPGKIIVTNTTTPADIEFFKKAGVKSVVTTTPVLDGRSFGTNMMEAGILTAIGRTQPVDYAHPGTYFEEMSKLVEQLGFQPQLQELN